MYIEMVDETGKVPVKMQEQIIELLQFAAKGIKGWKRSGTGI